MQCVDIFYIVWHMAAITVQSKGSVCLTTLSSVHNLIKTDDIVREHIQNAKMRSNCSSKGCIRTTVRFTSCNELWRQASFFDEVVVCCFLLNSHFLFFIFFKFCLKITDAADRLAFRTLHGLRCG